MAAEKGSIEKDVPSDERMSEPDLTDTVNPLYSLATSKSDNSSLGRQRTSAPVDQTTNDNTQAQRPVNNLPCDDTTSSARPADVSKTGVSSSGSFPSISGLHISGSAQSSAATEEQPSANCLLYTSPSPRDS